MPRGLRQIALSISFLSPIVSRPEAFLATKIASLIFLPERRFLDFTSFQSRTFPSLSFWKLLFDLPAQTVLFAFARTLPAAGKHPKPVAPAPYQENFATFRHNQL